MFWNSLSWFGVSRCSERFGKLPFGSAIYFAEPGFEVLPMLEGMIELRRDALSRRSGTKATCASHWQNTSGRMISDNARVVESERSVHVVGIEDPEDLIWDLEPGFAQVAGLRHG